MKIAKRLLAIPCYIVTIILTTIGLLGVVTAGRSITKLVNEKLWN